MYVVKEAL